MLPVNIVLLLAFQSTCILLFCLLFWDFFDQVENSTLVFFFQSLTDVTQLSVAGIVSLLSFSLY